MNSVYYSPSRDAVAAGGVVVTPGLHSPVASSPPRQPNASALRSPGAADMPTPWRHVTYSSASDKQIARRQESASRVRMEAEALLQEQRERRARMGGLDEFRHSLLDQQWAVKAPAPVHQVEPSDDRRTPPRGHSPRVRAASPYESDVYIPQHHPSPAAASSVAGGEGGGAPVAASPLPSADQGYARARVTDRGGDIGSQDGGLPPPQEPERVYPLKAPTMLLPAPQPDAAAAPPPEAGGVRGACARCEELEGRLERMERRFEALAATVARQQQEQQQARVAVQETHRREDAFARHDDKVATMYQQLLAGQQQQLEAQREASLMMDGGGSATPVRMSAATTAATAAATDDDLNEKELLCRLTSTGNMTPAEAQRYSQQLERSQELRRQAGAMSGNSPTPSSPSAATAAAAAAAGVGGGGGSSSAIARDDLLRVELRVFEKRLLSAVTQLANRVATLEGDVLQNTELQHQAEARLADRLEALQASTVSHADLRPKVLSIASSSRDDLRERVMDLYRLFDIDLGEVQAAVGGTTDDRVDTLLRSPALQGVFAMSLKNAHELSRLQQEVELGVRMRDASARTLQVFNRLLGLDVVDENDVRGVRVCDVFAGGPALAAGIRAGDVLSAVNHVPVASKADFLRVMAHVIPNSIVRILRVPTGRRVGDVVEVIASNGLYLSDPHSPIKPVSPYAKFGPTSVGSGDNSHAVGGGGEMSRSASSAWLAAGSGAGREPGGTSSADFTTSFQRRGSGTSDDVAHPRSAEFSLARKQV